MGHGAEWKLVFLEWKMERRREERTATLYRRLPPHRGPHARGGSGQPAMGLARELARRAGSEMEPVRELLSGRKLLRLGGAQCLRPADAARHRRDGEFSVQDADGVPAFGESRAGKASRDRRIRL